jgi:hypothetical protein
MSNVPPGFEWYHPDFHANSSKFTLEELLPYDGQHVAWSRDGTRILASGKDYDELYSKLDALGIASDQVIHDFIDLSGASHL